MSGGILVSQSKRSTGRGVSLGKAAQQENPIQRARRAGNAEWLPLISQYVPITSSIRTAVLYFMATSVMERISSSSS